MPTEDAYSPGHLVLSHFGACKCSNVEQDKSSDIEQQPPFGDRKISNIQPKKKGGVTKPTGTSYNFDKVWSGAPETNISWTCLVSGLLSFEHPSVLLFLLVTCVKYDPDLLEKTALVCKEKNKDNLQAICFYFHFHIMLLYSEAGHLSWKPSLTGPLLRPQEPLCICIRDKKETIPNFHLWFLMKNKLKPEKYGISVKL